jgi:hypothetical protein
MCLELPRKLGAGLGSLLARGLRKRDAKVAAETADVLPGRLRDRYTGPLPLGRRPISWRLTPVSLAMRYVDSPWHR